MKYPPFTFYGKVGNQMVANRVSRIAHGVHVHGEHEAPNGRNLLTISIDFQRREQGRLARHR